MKKDKHAGKAAGKTNAMRALEDLEQPYEVHDLQIKEAIDAQSVARMTGQAEETIFKTLVTESADHDHFVFMIPANGHLSLKKAAKAAGKKSLSMLAQKQLFPLTGYVHGGCSPLAMKKHFPTFIDQSALEQKTILFSAGKIGLQIETEPASFIQKCRIVCADLCE